MRAEVLCLRFSFEEQENKSLNANSMHAEQGHFQIKTNDLIIPIPN